MLAKGWKEMFLAVRARVGAGIVFWVFVRRQDDAIQVMHVGVLGPGADHFVAIVEGAVHGHVAVLICFGDSFACSDDGACAGYAVNVVEACYRAGREGAVDEGFVAGVDRGGGHFYEEVSGAACSGCGVSARWRPFSGVMQMAFMLIFFQK
jgi:hypothetical protein